MAVRGSHLCGAGERCLLMGLDLSQMPVTTPVWGKGNWCGVGPTQVTWPPHRGRTPVSAMPRKTGPSSHSCFLSQVLPRVLCAEHTPQRTYFLISSDAFLVGNVRKQKWEDSSHMTQRWRQWREDPRQRGSCKGGALGGGAASEPGPSLRSQGAAPRPAALCPHLEGGLCCHRRVTGQVSRAFSSFPCHFGLQWRYPVRNVSCIFDSVSAGPSSKAENKWHES